MSHAVAPMATSLRRTLVQLARSSAKKEKTESPFPVFWPGLSRLDAAAPVCGAE